MGRETHCKFCGVGSSILSRRHISTKFYKRPVFLIFLTSVLIILRVLDRVFLTLLPIFFSKGTAMNLCCLIK